MCEDYPDIESVTEPSRAEQIIALIKTLVIVKAEKIERLKGYIEYRERRHEIDGQDIEELKQYLEECLK